MSSPVTPEEIRERLSEALSDFERRAGACRDLRDASGPANDETRYRLGGEVEAYEAGAQIVSALLDSIPCIQAPEIDEIADRITALIVQLTHVAGVDTDLILQLRREVGALRVHSQPPGIDDVRERLERLGRAAMEAKRLTARIISHGDVGEVWASRVNGQLGLALRKEKS